LDNVYVIVIGGGGVWRGRLVGVGDAVAIAGEEEGEGSEDEDSGQREGVEEGAEILRSSDEAVGGDFSGSEG
jgi:hypothetical protein